MGFYMKLNIAINLLPVFACHPLLTLAQQFRAELHPALCSATDASSLDSEKQMEIALGFPNNLHLL